MENLLCQVRISTCDGLGSYTQKFPLARAAANLYNKGFKGEIQMTLTDLTERERQEAEKFWLEANQ